jgi:fructose-bisphosphate aldolase class II
LKIENLLNPYDILKSAQSGKYAIGSFNFSTAEILKAIVLAAQELKSPIIVSTSEGEAGFIGMREAFALVKAWRNGNNLPKIGNNLPKIGNNLPKIGNNLPIILNLDHGKSLSAIRQALECGYDAVHFDGSHLDYESNILETKAVVDLARDFEKATGKKIIVEGELGYLRGSSVVHKEKLEIKEEDLTSPEQAKDFIGRTGVDSLAIVIGNAHGVFVEESEKLYLDRLARIKEAVGNSVFLVLHGGSGISNEDIKKAIEIGIVKINVNTELRVAYHNALEKEMDEKPEETTPYKILEPSLEAVKKVVEGKIKLFGSENKI